VTTPIDRAEIEERLVALCIGGGPGLPKRSRDLQVLLFASTFWMKAGKLYSEKEVNLGLGRWLERGCPSLRVDVVTLRRLLVDDSYLDRDDSGRNYSTGRGPVGWRFAQDAVEVDPVDVVESALRRNAARKAEHLRGLSAINDEAGGYPC
jgi:hypothetical protein